MLHPLLPDLYPETRKTLNLTLMGLPPAVARELRSIDPQIWKACAGTGVTIHTVGSIVWYIPKGHAEQASSEPDFSSVDCRRPFFRCRITAVKFLANQDTDEVYAKITLEPLLPPYCAPAPSETISHEVAEERRVVAFGKILTQSDANNGGGFSVPRFCAESIFPLLDLTEDIPVQTIRVRDMHGIAWDLRYIFRGTPRRYLLTTGWSKFVNSKKLVTGDSVIFIKNKDEDLFVGIRRARRSCGSTPTYLIPPSKDSGVKIEEKVGIGQGGFSRNVKGRVPPESVVEAVRRAEMNLPFEVVYYPMAGSPDFVVGADIAEAAMRGFWTAGMRVKMSVETEDSSRMTWIHGTVSGWTPQDPVHWPNSPWRMLQVTWDEAVILQNVKSVNPWQVESASTTPHIQAPYGPYPNFKKLRVTPCPELANNGEGNMYFPMTGFNSRMMGKITRSLFNDNNIFPAGMQGARHDSTSESTLHNFVDFLGRNMYYENPSDKQVSENLIDVSTELTISSLAQSESSSSQGQGGSIQGARQDSTGYIRLFGQIIGQEQPRKSDGELFGQIIRQEQPFDSDGNEKRRQAESAVQSFDVFIRYDINQWLNKVDVQRASALPQKKKQRRASDKER